MPLLEHEVVRHDMADWSHPIVTDIVTERYQYLLGRNHALLKQLSRCHCVLWRALLSENTIAVAEAHLEILNYFRQVGLGQEVALQLHEGVLDELMDIVASRFHRSPARMSECSQVLLRVARHLTVLQVATSGI